MLAALPAVFSLQRTRVVLVVVDLETVDPGTVVEVGPGIVAGVGVGPGTVVGAVEQHQFAVGELAHHSTYLFQLVKK